MSNPILISLYKKVFEEEFNYDDFKSRMKMQNCIYLLEELGINVGDYEFTWYKDCPYSYRLQEDMCYIKNLSVEKLIFSDLAVSGIKRIKTMIAICRTPDFEYLEAQWIKCLASLHYLNRIFGGNKKRVLQELAENTLLKNDHLNQMAYKLILEI